MYYNDTESQMHETANVGKMIPAITDRELICFLNSLAVVLASLLDLNIMNPLI
jgi:hypothetical protein